METKSPSLSSHLNRRRWKFKSLLSETNQAKDLKSQFKREPIDPLNFVQDVTARYLQQKMAIFTPFIIIFMKVCYTGPIVDKAIPLYPQIGRRNIDKQPVPTFRKNETPSDTWIKFF